MGLYNYSTKMADEKKAARSQVHDVNASYKDLTQILAAIRGKTVQEATKVLQAAIEERKAIPYKRFAKHLGHRSELRGKKGRYPKKEAKIALELLKNATANAESKGLDKAKLFIRGAAAYKQNAFMRYRKYWASGVVIGYGRQSFASRYVTCWAEITLAERENKKEKAAKEEKPAEVEKKEEKLPAKEAKEKTTEKIEVATNG